MEVTNEDAAHLRLPLDFEDDDRLLFPKFFADPNTQKFMNSNSFPIKIPQTSLPPTHHSLPPPASNTITGIKKMSQPMPEPRLGIYNQDERNARLEAYRQKRKKRVFGQVRYVLRKKASETRARVKGRFVKASTLNNQKFCENNESLASAFQPLKKEPRKEENELKILYENELSMLDSPPMPYPPQNVPSLLLLSNHTILPSSAVSSDLVFGNFHLWE